MLQRGAYADLATYVVASVVGTIVCVLIGGVAAKHFL